ncbi:related to zinc-binding oxidoreductase [Ramularia collo-cygni]|uniref:Related to zinc-binding oxidoreductase n=1 Tax=Ramularia collo-cygni TaxID=112498 RepID=A0A2D3UYL0_9PEZI|nr:related to zinc-binding oxidoreductase [Ramularia collo-cygni]CZT16276.1 related to zinc-binding oxidoreductase [Ramularia collo-cygni]
MSLPTTSRNWRRTQDGKSIELVSEKLPSTLGSKEVLLQIHAVSLNYRDIAMLDGSYPMNVIDRGVPCSDASATVVAVGSSVETFKKGDRVAPSFTHGFVTGQEKRAKSKSLGGDLDGVLREYAIYEHQFLTKAPDYLSHNEISTIACAGVTAWTSLDMENPISTAEYALMQGTGGVSIFAALICVAAGITPIVTSSSDEKLEQIKALGTENTPVLGINYRTHKDWAGEARRLTNEGGVDIVVNNIGINAMQESIDALCLRGGIVSVVGFLGGIPEMVKDFIMPAMFKTATIKAIGVGSTKDQQDLCNFLAKHKIDLEPLVDKVFEFEDAQAAFKHLSSGAHVGKIVIKVR